MKDLTEEEFHKGIREIWDKRNDEIMEIATPILAQKAEGSYRDVLNELQKFMSSGILDCTVENIYPYLSEEQVEKVTPWLIENGYSHLLKNP